MKQPQKESFASICTDGLTLDLSGLANIFRFPGDLDLNDASMTRANSEAPDSTAWSLVNSTSIGLTPKARLRESHSHTALKRRMVTFGIQPQCLAVDDDDNQGAQVFDNEWLTTKEAAEYLRIPIGSLKNMTSNGQVLYYKLGRRNRYWLPDLRKLLLSEKRGS